jgi:hypothetical protein
MVCPIHQPNRSDNGAVLIEYFALQYGQNLDILVIELNHTTQRPLLGEREVPEKQSDLREKYQHDSNR